MKVKAIKAHYSLDEGYMSIGSTYTTTDKEGASLVKRGLVKEVTSGRKPKK